MPFRAPNAPFLPGLKTPPPRVPLFSCESLSLLNRVRNGAMLERIIKIMVSAQGNGCPPILDPGQDSGNIERRGDVRISDGAGSAWEQHWPPMEAAAPRPLG
ncbi:MAG: hypothetical protein ABSE82_11730, partial [Nitrososphaerales archaeon]